MVAWWEEKDDESHHLEQKVSTNGSELERENEIIFTAEENKIILAAERTIAEMDRINQEKNKKNKFFLGFAIFLYIMGIIMSLEHEGEVRSMFLKIYFVAGTVCLFIQYLVSIGKVGFGEGTSEYSRSSWDGSDYN